MAKAKEAKRGLPIRTGRKANKSKHYYSNVFPKNKARKLVRHLCSDFMHDEFAEGRAFDYSALRAVRAMMDDGFSKLFPEVVRAEAEKLDELKAA